MSIEETFRAFTERKGLKRTRQRDLILQTFLATTTHLSTDELYQLLRRDNPGIGYATVHRTLKLFAESGIAIERNFGDGQTRYELTDGEEHHDHLICTSCGRIIEFEDPKIEQLQAEIASRHGFEIVDHRLELFGFCAECSRKSRMKTHA